MSNWEIDRLKVIQNTIDGKFTWPQAAQTLSLSGRRVGRLCARVRKEGNRGVIHGLKGRGSNNKLPVAFIAQAVSLVERHYPDFMPTFANEQLFERHS